VRVELDLTSVDSFIAVAATLHFGQAAIRLHITASALTKRIQKLERQLGVRLFERGPTGTASLTPAGRRFSPHADALLQKARAARMAARGAPMPLEYRLGLPGQLHDHPELARLPAVAAKIREEHPFAIIHCYGVPFPFVLAALLNGTVDVMWDVSTTNHPRIESIPLHPFERIGVVSIDHAFAGESEIDVGEFAKQPMLYGRGVPQPWMARFYLDDVRPMAEARLVPTDGVNSTEVKASIGVDHGVTVAPAFMARALGPKLTSVKLIDVPPVASFATRRRSDDRASVLTLIDALESVQQP
jgi:DNA-binding transcriptional LysR family regulator